MIYHIPKFGFESTWRNKVRKWKNMNEATYNLEPTLALIIMQRQHMYFFRDPKVDFYNIEIPTIPIPSFIEDRFFEQFQELKDLLGMYNIVPSSCSDDSHLEGGGHIHLDLGCNFKRKSKTRGLFLQNLLRFMISNPYLAWAFNCPMDSVASICPIHYYLTYTETLKSDKKANKCYSVMLRGEFNTVEFRFFSMPKTVEQLKYHLSVARAIYKYCFDMACRREVILLEYNSYKQIRSITLTESIASLVILMEYTLKIKPEEYLFDNLRQRYAIEYGLKLKKSKQTMLI